jgi:hypothetical protein
MAQATLLLYGPGGKNKQPGCGDLLYCVEEEQATGFEGKSLQPGVGSLRPMREAVAKFCSE